MNYVLGFYFRGPRGLEEVALIQKARPHWQAGKLNGVGGKVDSVDGPPAAAAPVKAMVREFAEETGLHTRPEDWREFGVLQHDGNVVHLFTARPKAAGALLTKTDEEVNWYPVRALDRLPVMPNLLWMVPLALDKDQVTALIQDASRIPAKPPTATHELAGVY